MKSIHQYTCTAYRHPDPAPSHPQYESVALPGVTRTGYKHKQNPIQSQYNNLIFKCDFLSLLLSSLK